MKKLLIALLFCILTLGIVSVASAAEWKWVQGNMDYIWHFDTQSLKKVNDTTYSVWIKQEYNAAIGKETAEQFNFKAPVAYDLTKCEYDFRDKTFRSVAVSYYNKKGRVLSSDKTHEQWRAIFPDTVGEEIFNKTYEYYKKYYK